VAITYTSAINSVRGNLQISTTEDATISNAEILSKLNEVYSQWWRMFFDHPSALTGAASTSAGIVTNGWKTLITGTGLVDISSVHASTSSASSPGDSGTFPLERISLDEMMYFHRCHVNVESAGAGFPTTPVSGVPKYYSVQLTQDSGQWSLWVYPPCSVTYYFPMMVRKPPDALTSANFTAHVCLDDEMVAICAVTALRLLANIGRQNDQGLIQVIASSIPQEMQAMSFSPKTETMK
jgi:hypothetical protein